MTSKEIKEKINHIKFQIDYYEQLIRQWTIENPDIGDVDAQIRTYKVYVEDLKKELEKLKEQAIEKDDIDR